MRADDDTATHRDAAGDPEAGSQPTLYLVLQANVPLPPPARVSLEGVRELVIGRGDGRELASGVLRIPGDHLSRRHARLTRQGPVFLVEDLGSKNGTFLDGVRLTQPTPLRPGDVLELGGCLFSLRHDLRGPGSPRTSSGSRARRRAGGRSSSSARPARARSSSPRRCTAAPGGAAPSSR